MKITVTVEYTCIHLALSVQWARPARHHRAEPASVSGDQDNRCIAERGTLGCERESGHAGLHIAHDDTQDGEIVRWPSSLRRPAAGIDPPGDGDKR